MAAIEDAQPVTPHPHWGHEGLRSALARARIRDSLPSTLLIHGTRGVGKQHLGLWLGRLLLCSNPSPEGPCEECRACRLANKLEHPDLHWYFPLPRPRGVHSPEKLEEALEEARTEALEERRRNPLRASTTSELRGLYLAAARRLRRNAQRRPSMGERQVFLIADAETLAPQASSSEAANALLKILEEPPADTTLILTSSEPGKLLPTIRSRATQLHLPPLTTPEVTRFLIEIAGVDDADARKAGRLSQGSIGRALGFLPDGDTPGPLEEKRNEALRLLSAALARDPGPSFEVAGVYPSTGGRGLFELLDFVEEGLRDLAFDAAAPGTGIAVNPDIAPLRDRLQQGAIEPVSLAHATRAVDSARALASGNVNPQLVVFGLLQDLRKELQSSTRPTPHGS